MSDPAFTTTISTAGLSPEQCQRVDARLREETIAVTWLDQAVQVDQAFESRVETIVGEARDASPTTPAAPPAGFAPTAASTTASYPTAQYPAAQYPTGGYPAPGQPAAAYPAPGYGYVPQSAPTNSNATMSLVLALVGWAVCPIASVFGVIYGRRAQEEIAGSGGTQGGEGLAKAGIIISWIVLAIWGVVIIGFVIFLVAIALIGATS